MKKPANRSREFRRSLFEQLVYYLMLMRMHQPIGIWLLLWPTLWALWIASDGQPDEEIFIVMVLGTVLMRAAGCVINDFADRKIDKYVARTRSRPLAAGLVTPTEALVLFAGLLIIALGVVLRLNWLAIQFALFGAVVTIAYPFMKRFFAAPQFVLGIAFSWGVPMAFAAQSGGVPRIGWLIFLAAVVWVFIYDTQYAMVDREDDLRIGVKSTAVLLGAMDKTFLWAMQILFFATMLMIGRDSELGTWFYGGLCAAGLCALYQQWLVYYRNADECLKAFQNNAWLGGYVFAGLLLDTIFNR